ncbi:MAG: hypothetical protein ACD_40C00268G0005 [uncultured bacterium]|nr:MAG: hypothetical protein ACD_40C00268G0005 [uncultured bacterium]
MKTDLYKQVVWDYNLSQAQFEDILSGKNVLGTLDQSWAMARVLENLHYYDALDLVPFATLSKNWDNVKSKIFIRGIRDGYEFVLQRHSLPTAR